VTLGGPEPRMIGAITTQQFPAGRFSPLQVLGRSSLFIYWIHVEMVYGIASFWLHKALTFEQAVVSYVAFSLFLFGLVKLKDRVLQDPAPPHSPALAPSPGA